VSSVERFVRSLTTAGDGKASKGVLGMLGGIQVARREQRWQVGSLVKQLVGMARQGRVIRHGVFGSASRTQASQHVQLLHCLSCPKPLKGGADAAAGAPGSCGCPA
jgi:hypothetical protein